MVVNKVSLPIKFQMALPPSQIRGNNRSHHFIYNKHFQNYKNNAIGNVLEAINLKGYEFPYKKVLIVYTFMNNRLIDIDNFIYGMKAVQDALSDDHYSCIILIGIVFFNALDFSRSQERFFILSTVAILTSRG